VVVPVVVAAPLEVSDEQRGELEVMARSAVLPYRVVVQARALLWAGEGVANEEIARRCETTPDTVRRWRRRFVEHGVSGVGKVAPGRGRKPAVRAALAADIVHTTLHERPPGDETQWSTRLMAERFGVGKDTVARIWRARKIQPHRVKYFKVSTDPDFEAKLADVVGLYLDPPERAVVFSVDEKTQVQALDRTQPSLPLKAGRAATMTHDYKRNGTTNLFAALDVATAKVLTLCQPRHRYREFLAFLKMVNSSVPAGMNLHVICDNVATHKHPRVRAWLARHPRVQLHFTPTSSSWLNLVELWFRQITNRRLRRAAFASVDELIDAIDDWTDHWNETATPFVWTKTTEEILAKVRSARAALTHHTNTATHH
jgi:transposase